MIKRVLTPLDLTDHTVAATHQSCEIASKLHASITGLTVVDTEGIRDAAALPFRSDALDIPNPKVVKMLADASKKLETARSTFKDACVAKNVPCDLRQLSGRPVDGILDLSRFYDLVVMGAKSHFHFETEDKEDCIQMQILDQATVPVLLTPAFEKSPFERALIAYDGSPSATRALHAFVDLWSANRPLVRVVTAVHDKELGGRLLDEAQKFLQSHGIKDITTELTDQSIKKAFEERHLEWASVIVAGVRSKKPLKHLFLGSFAQYLVKQTHRSVFFCQ